MKRKFTYNVVQVVEVELDEEDVNQEYLEAFSDVMWPIDSIEDIAEYIARQKALFDGYSIEFVPRNYSAKVVDEYTEESF